MGPAIHSDIDFERLFRSNYVPMYRCALNLVQDADIAKDIVQEVFLKCWNNKKTLHAVDNLTGYLLTATNRTAYNYLRDHKHIVKVDVSSTEVLNISTHRSAAQLEYSELELAVANAIQQLPVQCRSIFQLSRQEGLTYPQIAERLELSVKTVEKQMGIALCKLRESLKPFLVTNLSTLLLTAGSYGWLVMDFFKFFSNSL